MYRLDPAVIAESPLPGTSRRSREMTPILGRERASANVISQRSAACFFMDSAPLSSTLDQEVIRSPRQQAEQIHQDRREIDLS